MNIFGILSMIGGLALFLYGMDAMGAGLSKCNDSNGSRFCKFRNHETEPGCRYHYGSKYRYDNYILALKSYRDSGK